MKHTFELSGYKPRPKLRLPAVRDQRDFWRKPAIIARNNFVFKSLSSWSYNPAVGCLHGCRFCYVPSATTIKLGPLLTEYGVYDADADWGGYVMVRPFDEKIFRASLKTANNTPISRINPDGNRAVMFSTTTDAWQVISHADPVRRDLLNGALKTSVRTAIRIILEESDLNIRILTRGPLVRRDFDLLQGGGNRVLLGFSIPTLRDDLARVYEPNAPAPSQRLRAIEAAHQAGIPVFVAIAPTYPECDREDIKSTMELVKQFNPVTIFMEPINIRAKNVSRIAARAKELNVELNLDVFASKSSWRKYAIGALKTAENVAQELGVQDRLHLWPDKVLGSKAALRKIDNPEAHQAWLNRCWNRISEWPK